MTYEECLRLFNYDKESGKLFWKLKPSNSVSIGREVGSTNSGGYLQAKKKMVHKIIWLHQKGVWPNNQLDHINGDRKDNRIENLRQVTNRINCHNKKVHREGNLLGAYFDKRRNHWRSQIRVDKYIIYLGCFKTQLEAHSAYINKCKELGFL